MKKAPSTTAFRLTALALITALALPNPVYALRPSNLRETPKGLAGLEEALQPSESATGLEEPIPPQLPSDFGKEPYGIVTVGGIEAYVLQPGDRILPQVTYESPPPWRNDIDYRSLRPGTNISVRKIQTFPVPLEILGRFALGALTFQLVPFGVEERGFPEEDSSGGGVAVAPMAQRYLLQVWLEGRWVDLDQVPLDDGVPVVIGRERLPKTLNPLTQVDLEGKVGTPVSDDQYEYYFDGWFGDDGRVDKTLSEWRITVSWYENGLGKTLYLPRQALNNRQTSRGDARTDPRPGWNVANRKYVPEYLQAGHLHVEVMGEEVVFSDLGSTSSTVVEVRSDWLATQQARIQEGRIEQDLFSETDSIVNETRLASAEGKPDEVSLERIAEMEQRLGDNLIVIGRLETEGAEVNPEKAVRFPFEQPFEVSLRVEGAPRAVEQFKVQNKRLYHRKPTEKTWQTTVDNSRWTEEFILVPGQAHLGDMGSRLAEGYRVLYVSALNAVFILNHSPYQVRVTSLASAGLEELDGPVREALQLFQSDSKDPVDLTLLENRLKKLNRAQRTQFFKTLPWLPNEQEVSRLLKVAFTENSDLAGKLRQQLLTMVEENWGTPGANPEMILRILISRMPSKDALVLTVGSILRGIGDVLRKQKAEGALFAVVGVAAFEAVIQKDRETVTLGNRGLYHKLALTHERIAETYSKIMERIPTASGNDELYQAQQIEKGFTFLYEATAQTIFAVGPSAPFILRLLNQQDYARRIYEFGNSHLIPLGSSPDPHERFLALGRLAELEHTYADLLMVTRQVERHPSAHYDSARAYREARADLVREQQRLLGLAPVAGGLEEGETRRALAEAFAGFTRVYGPRYGHKQSILGMNLRHAKGQDIGIVRVQGGILRKYEEEEPLLKRPESVFSDWSNLGPDHQLSEPYAVNGLPDQRLPIPVSFAAEDEAIFFPLTPDQPVAMTGPSYMTSVLVMGRGVDADGVPGLFQWHYFPNSPQPESIASRLQSDLPKFLNVISQGKPLASVQVVINAAADVAGSIEPAALQRAWASEQVRTVTVFPRTGVDVAPVANGDGFGFALLRGHLVFNSDLGMGNPDFWDSDEERFQTWRWDSLQTETMDTLLIPEVDYAQALFQEGDRPIEVDSEEFPATQVFRIDRAVLVPFELLNRPQGFQIVSVREMRHDAVSEFLQLSQRTATPDTVELKRLTWTTASDQRQQASGVVKQGKAYVSSEGIRLSIRRGKGIVVQPQNRISRVFLEKVSPTGLEEIRSVLIAGRNSAEIERVSGLVAKILPGAEIRTLTLPVKVGTQFQGADLAISTQYELAPLEMALLSRLPMGFITPADSASQWEEWQLRQAIADKQADATGAEEGGLFQRAAKKLRQIKEGKWNALLDFLDKNDLLPLILESPNNVVNNNWTGWITQGSLEKSAGVKKYKPKDKGPFIADVQSAVRAAQEDLNDLAVSPAANDLLLESEWEVSVKRLGRVIGLVITIMQTTDQEDERAVKQGEEDVVNALIEAFRLAEPLFQQQGRRKLEEFEKDWLDLIYILTDHKFDDRQQAIQWLKEHQRDEEWRADVFLSLVLANGVSMRFKQTPPPTSIAAFTLVAESEYAPAVAARNISGGLQDARVGFSEPLIPGVVSRMAEVIEYPDEITAGLEEPLSLAELQRLKSGQERSPSPMTAEFLGRLANTLALGSDDPRYTAADSYLRQLPLSFRDPVYRTVAWLSKNPGLSLPVHWEIVRDSGVSVTGYSGEDVATFLEDFFTDPENVKTYRQVVVSHAAIESEHLVEDTRTIPERVEKGRTLRTGPPFSIRIGARYTVYETYAFDPVNPEDGTKRFSYLVVQSDPRSSGLEEKDVETLLQELKQVPPDLISRVEAMRQVVVKGSDHFTPMAAFAVAAGRPEWTDEELADLFVVLTDLFDGERQAQLKVRAMVRQSFQREPVTPLTPLPNRGDVVRAIGALRQSLAPEPLPEQVIQAATQRKLPEFSNLVLVGAWMLSELAEVASVREPVQSYFQGAQQWMARLLLYWRLGHFETRIWRADLLAGFSIERREDLHHFFEVMDAAAEALPEGSNWSMDVYNGLTRRYQSADKKVSVATDGPQIQVTVETGGEPLQVTEAYIPDLINTVLEVRLGNRRIWQWDRPQDERRLNQLLVGLKYDPNNSKLTFSINRRSVPAERIELLQDRVTRLLGPQAGVSLEWVPTDPPAWTERTLEEWNEGETGGLEESGAVREFGKTRLKFYVMGTGTAWLGRPWPPGSADYAYPAQAEIDAYLDQAFARLQNPDGRVLIDTAASYGFSEARIGDYLRARPDYFRDAFIATKWGEQQTYDGAQPLPKDQWKFQPVYTLENLQESVRQSIAHLGRIDLLYLHMAGTASLDDTLRNGAIIEEMVRMKASHHGGIHFLGASISDAEVLGQAVQEGLLNPFDVIQMPGTIFLNRPDLVQALRQQGKEKAIVLNSVIRKGEKSVSEQESHVRLLNNPDVSMILLGSRNHYWDNISTVESWARSRPSGLEESDDAKLQQVLQGSADPQESLARQGWTALNAAQAGEFQPGAWGALLIRDSAVLKEPGQVIVAEKGLHNRRAEDSFSWFEPDEPGADVAIRYARGFSDQGLQQGDLLLLKPAENLSLPNAVSTLLDQYGFDPEDRPRVAIGDESQVESLPAVAFHLLAGQPGLPPVVFLDVRVRLRDEAGNTYTLILMA